MCWPDDSSYHLAHALPLWRGRRRALASIWGAVQAFAPLYRPEPRGARRCRWRFSTRARSRARAGSARELSGIAHVHRGHLAVSPTHRAPRRLNELVTCNAPIPGARDPALWHRADAELFARLWRTAAARVTPNGMIVVHGVLRELRGVPAVGERVIVAYTPPDADAEFGVLWWRPGASARCIEQRRELVAERAHVDARDRDDALITGG